MVLEGSNSGHPFAARAAFEPTLNEFSKALAQARRERTLFDLTRSNPTDAALPTLGATAREVLGAPDVARYQSAPLGLPKARARVAREFGWDPAHTILASSTSEIYGWLFHLLCDADDAVAVPCPSYPLFAELARAAGVRTHPYALECDDGWAVSSLEELEGVRAILAVSPNNPTGSVTTDRDRLALESLGVPLIVDEVFGAYCAERPVHSPIASSGLRITLGGLSKYAALPQMKLAWAHVSGEDVWVDEALRRLAHLADVQLALSTPPQVALDELLEFGARARVAIQTRLARNLEALRAALLDSAVTAPAIDGGWYAPLRVPATESDESWALAMLDADVAVHPGYFYDFPRGCWLVVSLLTPEDEFAAGIARLREVVDART